MREGVHSIKPNMWCLEIPQLPETSHPICTPPLALFFPSPRLVVSSFLPPSKLPIFHVFLPHHIFPTYRKGIHKMRVNISTKLRRITKYSTFGLFKCLACFPCLYPLKSQELGFAEMEWQWGEECFP